MRVDLGLAVEAEAEVEYGPYRLRVAEWAGKDPAAVTAHDVGKYEIACDEEGRRP